METEQREWKRSVWKQNSGNGSDQYGNRTAGMEKISMETEQREWKRSVWKQNSGNGNDQYGATGLPEE